MLCSIFDYQLNERIMKNLTITINGNKAGELVYFSLNVQKQNFLKVINMTFETIQDVLKGEKDGFYTINK